MLIWLIVAGVLLAMQMHALPTEFQNRAPAIRDCAEVHNIAWNLARGNGYRFDWDSPEWRQDYEAQNSNGSYNHLLARRNSYATLCRPPLMPLVLSVCIALCPAHQVFWSWRLVDMTLCAAAGALLCLVDPQHCRVWSFPAAWN